MNLEAPSAHGVPRMRPMSHMAVSRLASRPVSIGADIGTDFQIPTKADFEQLFGSEAEASSSGIDINTPLQRPSQEYRSPSQDYNNSNQNSFSGEFKATAVMESHDKQRRSSFHAPKSGFSFPAGFNPDRRPSGGSFIAAARKSSKKMAEMESSGAVEEVEETAETLSKSSIAINVTGKAAERINGKVHCTPVLTSETLSKLTPVDPLTNEPRKLYFKCENLQKVGAFKFRGASNAIAQIPDADKSKGVVTHSSGNHAQALALAANNAGIPCTIIMPRNAPLPKVAAVRDYGATIQFCEPTQQAREDAASKVVQKTGGVFVHPYNDARIIAGQGTLALEFLEQVAILQEGGDGPPLDAVIIPIGGGGMLSGCIVALKSLHPSIRVFAAEPQNVDDAYTSFTTKTLQTTQKPLPSKSGPRSIADGLLTTLGDKTWPVVRDWVDAVFTVSEKEIVDAMKLVWERMKLVIEPSAAVGVAVALYNKEFAKVEGVRNVGIVLCGGRFS
ncbi:hypothetical protein HDV05_007139 [Chytridiales sp. JEL 0842]|nr:hypothetical protein HDV05_007139 [Chytridiales sp. JEL 0842]